eukprot:648497-Amphidinium_carterae.1
MALHNLGQAMHFGDLCLLEQWNVPFQRGSQRAPRASSQNAPLVEESCRTLFMIFRTRSR